MPSPPELFWPVTRAPDLPTASQLLLRAIAKQGPDARRAIPALAAHLSDPHPLVPLVAAQALLEVGGCPAPLQRLATAIVDNEVAGRIAELDSPSWRVIRSALYALRRLGPLARAAIPKLRVLLGEGYKQKTRKLAREVLTRVGHAD